MPVDTGLAIADAISTYLLLGIGVALAAGLVATGLSNRIDQIFTRIAVAVFGNWVAEHGRNQTARTKQLRAAQFATTYRMYAAQTILYAAIGAVVAGIVGIYLVWGILRVLALDPETLQESLPAQLSMLADFAGIDVLSPIELFPLFLISAATIGGLTALMIYRGRWWYPSSLAGARQRQIEATLPQVVAFMYALSRSGMEFPQVMRILADHKRIYGAAAEEINVAVRHMDVFGRDTVTAVRTMGRRSPSETFKEFSENLASVLQSGRNLEQFLDAQYEKFQDEAESQQQQLLTQLSTLAEVYVVAFVAAPLFLITILAIIGIAGMEVLQPLRAIVYIVLPLMNIVFLLYLDSVMRGFGESGAIDRPDKLADENIDAVPYRGTDPRITDGGTAAEQSDQNLKRLNLYRRLQWVRENFGSPIKTIRTEPVKLLWATIPIATVVTALRIWQLEQLTVTAVDDLIVQAGLFVIGTFAVAYELYRRRIERIESTVPDFLSRMASVNESGMSIIDSIQRTRRSDLGALGPEIDRLWADLQWGTTIKTAFKRLEYRVPTRAVSQVVALITNAMSASGNVARVLQIAADQARADRSLKRQRRQEMLTYTIVVYIGFGVFLLVIAFFDQVLLPSLPEEGLVPEADTPGAVPGGGFAGGVGATDLDAFAVLLRHAVLIQAVTTGLIAGQMSRGTIKAGAKHATIMLAIAYIGLLIIERTEVLQQLLVV